MVITTRLFSLRGSTYFPDGTLFELAEGAELTLPDRGDGEPGTIACGEAVECEAFAANVPPGECRVAVTSFSSGADHFGAAAVAVDESIHFQVLIVPGSVSSVIVTNRAKMFEADSYYPSDSGEDKFRLHIGHLPPGFYEAAIVFADGSEGRLTFIKFFPERFAADATPVNSPDLTKPDSVPALSSDPEADLLNTALELATEWGENFGKPIHDRIRMFFPHLTDDAIDELTERVREAESYIYKLAEKELEGDIAEADIRPQALERYPWLNDHNVGRLSNIGMYYARR